jgi:serine/threonine protein kinase
VALKILRDEHVKEPTIIERFKREANIGINIKHPNIVPVFSVDSVRHGNREVPYIESEYVSGGSLAKLLKSNPRVTLEQANDIIGQVSSALHYAHERRIVHRDVKLENILVYPDSRYAITDFGIARILETDVDDPNNERLTQTMMQIGTPFYMSPEQVNAERLIDRRADVYALGVMAYLLTTGYFPFAEGGYIQIMIAHTQKEPPHPTEKNPDLHQAFNTVILKALEKRPQNRYPTAIAFAQAFQDALERTTRGTVVQTPRAGTNNKTGTSSIVQVFTNPRTRMIAIPVLTVFIIAIAGLIFLAVLQQGSATFAAQQTATAEQIALQPTITPLPPTVTPFGIVTSPQPRTTATPTNVVIRCFVVATTNSYSVYTAPDFNATEITTLPINQEITITGRTTDTVGQLWWQINTSSNDTTAWLPPSDLIRQGDCGNIPLITIATPSTPTDS